MTRPLHVLAIIAVIILGSCTSYVRIDTVQPAAVNIPKDYKKVLLINRTGEDPAFAATNKLERMLTGDWSKRNTKLSFSILHGLSAELTNSMKHYEVQILKDTILRGTGNQTFPATLTTTFIDSLCAKYGVDFVIALETFGLDVVNKANGTPAVMNVVGLAINTLSGPTYSLGAVVKAGWRIYPAGGSNLIDQFPQVMSWDFGRDGIPDQAVLLQLSNAKESMNKALRTAGNRYGSSITPHPLVLQRKVYTSGSSSLNAAARYTSLGQWDNAMAIWDKNLNGSSIKVRKRSLYNLAVYYELNNNLDAAIKMAETSYIECGFKDGLYYSNDLKHRKSMESKVREQMGE